MSDEEDKSPQGNSNVDFKDGDEEEETTKKPKFDIITNKKNIPIKAQIKQMEKDISELRNGLNDNKKKGMMLKNELILLEGAIKEKCNELSKSITDDLKNFEKDLKRVIQNDKQEIKFFEIQVNALKDDKVKLEKETVSLNSRLKTCEFEIGVDPK